MILHLDLETRSDIDLKTAGVYVYARGRNTDMVCACFAFNDEPVRVWLPNDPVPFDVVEHISLGGEVHAHNATFEFEMINNCGQKYGWPKLELNQMHCTLATAFSMGLPGSLDGAAAALATERKDDAGRRIMLQLSQPRDILPSGKIVWWDDPEKLKILIKYCKQDVVVERAIEKKMLTLSEYERRVWLLDQKINARGITIDVKAVNNALLVIEEEKNRLHERMRFVSGNQIASCYAVAQIKKYLISRGVEVKTLAKKELDSYINLHNLPEDCKSVLMLRQEAGKASTAKLTAMAQGVSDDNRLRGCFQYSGANTRRWSGRRVQLHNLKRPSISHKTLEEILDRLSSGEISAEEIETYYGPPMSIIGDCIRGFIMAAPGHELLCSDFSAIEARVLAWLAGEESVLNIFKNGEDIYVHEASHIFGVHTDKATDAQRQVGKVAVLALGFGGGVGAFQTMAKGYGVQMAPALEALKSRTSSDVFLKAQKAYAEYLKKAEDPISLEEHIASNLTKVLWRESNPEIVSYWYALEDAAICAVQNPKKVFKAGYVGREVGFATNGSFLWCKLPSGGFICYPYPKVEMVKTPWGDTKTGLTYMSEDGQSKQWQRFKTYGGSLCENITQSVARDLLADAMLRLEEKGYPIVVHVHDEIVCELPIGKGKIEDVNEIMSEPPAWAKDLPLSAKGWQGKRYRK